MNFNVCAANTMRGRGAATFLGLVEAISRTTWCSTLRAEGQQMQTADCAHPVDHIALAVKVYPDLEFQKPEVQQARWDCFKLVEAASEGKDKTEFLSAL